MPYIVDNELSFSTAGGTSFPLTMPIHAANDLLIAMVTEDGTGTLAMTGWLAIGAKTNGNGNSHATAAFYRVATSSSDTGTVTMGTADAIAAIVLSIRDVDVSTLATTATSGTGSVCTITFATQAATPYPAGTIITVANVTPAAYNGTFVSTGGSTSTVTYAHTATGAQTVAGTITAQIDNATTPSATAAASQYSSETIATNKADSMLLFWTGTDGVAPMAHTDPGPAMFVRSMDSTGTTATTSCGTAVAWYMQRAVATSPAPSWTVDKSAAYNRQTISIRNAASGIIPAYIDDVTSPGLSLSPMHHIGAAGLNGINYSTSLPYSDAGPNGAGLALTFDAAGLTADYAINFFSSAVNTTPPAKAAGTAAGFVIAKASGSWNLSTGFVVGSCINANPKNANFFHGSTAQGGTFLSFGDASNFYRSYQVLARDSKPNTEGRSVFSVQVGQADTRYGFSSSTLVDTAVTTVMFLTNCPLSTITMYFSELHVAYAHVIAGGSSAAPVDTVGVAAVGTSFRLPLIQQVGAAGLLSYVPIQIGGGDAVNFQIDAGALQFPRRWNTATRELNFHATDNAIGIDYAGKAGDVIKHTNSVVTSASQYYWRINAAATNAASWDFAGLTVVGATVTLRNVMTFAGMTFASCLSIDATGCTVSGCTINKVPTGNDKLTTNGSTVITGCSIDVSQVTAGNRWCSVANPSIFSNTDFIGGGGHAIRITSPGTYTLTNLTWTSFGADESTGAAIFNDSGGAVTLTISGGGAPTVKNGAGASTTVDLNAVDTTVTVIDAVTGDPLTARVLVFAANATGPMPFGLPTDIERSGATATATTISPHGLKNGKKALITGAVQEEYNGVHVVTVTGVSTFTYTVSGAPSSPATGIPATTGVVIDGDTVAGVITDNRSHASNQPITGRVRKATDTPRYKTGQISGTILSASGFSVTVQMVRDD